MPIIRTGATENQTFETITNNYHHLDHHHRPMIATTRGKEPNRERGLNRAEKALKSVNKTLANLHARNNSTSEEASILLFTTVYISRLQNIKFNDLQIEGLQDHNRKAKTYYILLSGLFLHAEPITKTYLINFFGFSYTAAMPVINNLIQSGYIEESESSRPEQIGGRFCQIKRDAIKLTAKGLDKLAFITDLLTDKRLF